MQNFYIPSATALREGEDEDMIDTSPGEYRLLLPSQLPEGVDVNLSLCRHEWHLRVAGADDELEALRLQLRQISGIYHYAKRFSRSQKDGTRSRTAIESFQTAF